MNWKRFFWTFGGWVFVGSAFAGVLMSLGVGPDMARFDASTIALAIVRTQATGIAAVALCLGLVAGTHGARGARVPPALALIVPVSAVLSALLALAASALVLRGLALADYVSVIGHHLDASDPLLGFTRACLVAGVLAATTPSLVERMNRALEWLPSKIFLAWLYPVLVVGVIELGMRAVLLRWSR
jgi:hypothetical protein